MCTVLYIGTLVATRYNPRIKAFYERLLAAGKVKSGSDGVYASFHHTQRYAEASDALARPGVEG
jgi:hypothetical protein